MTECDIKYMQEGIAADLAQFLSDEFGMNVTESLDTLYSSDTYAKLMDKSTGFYFQSSGYVYSFLRNEIMTGKIA